MINTIMMVTSLSGMVLSLITFILLNQLYKKYSVMGLRYLSIGFLSYGLIPVTYILLSLEASSRYALLATNIHKLFTTATFSIGFNLTLLGFQSLIEAKIPKRYFFYFVINLFVLPFAFYTGFAFQWSGTEWISIYEPEFFRVLIILPTFYVGIEVGLATYKLVKDSPYNGVMVLLIAMTLSFLLVVPAFLFRQQLNLPFNAFVTPMLLYFGFLALIIRTAPELFLTTSIDPQFLLIIDAQTGIPIKIYHFIENEYSGSSESLMAGALIAIQTVLKELSETAQEISYIGFPNTHITIDRDDNWQFILGSERKSLALKSLLAVIKDKFHLIDLEPGLGMLTPEDESSIANMVSHVFKHQMNRLDLKIRSVTK